MQKMIHAKCHGCDCAMDMEAVPVTIKDIAKGVKTHYGKSESVWICKSCRPFPARMKAARLAAGMPAKPESSSFEDEQEIG